MRVVLFSNNMQGVSKLQVRNLKAGERELRRLRMCVRKCIIEGVEGAVEFSGQNHFAGFSRHYSLGF